MMVLNEVTPGGLSRREIWPDDVLCVSNVPGSGFGAEIETIDGKRFSVIEDVGEVFALMEESDGAGDE